MEYSKEHSPQLVRKGCALFGFFSPIQPFSSTPKVLHPQILLHTFLPYSAACKTHPLSHVIKTLCCRAETQPSHYFRGFEKKIEKKKNLRHTVDTSCVMQGDISGDRKT